ncbi:hypothetical protein OG453_38070 [Streptomyces sp. NBC_01381]|uniref:hypothetical protein n=1 Tax=Streptomyces sp. NBC_01381 TaxID=2903845 RepID=UPI00225C08D2|nr:hypothetical protein [Streptomyces sp. NBC_01381]MCX4672400.1 hypothetical protein [Streptomyces sp. NBC_01381]
MSTPTTAPAPTGDPQTPAPATPSTSSTPQQPQAPAVPQPPQPGEPQDLASLPDWAQKLIKDRRAEAADYRTRAQQAAPQPPTPQAPAAPPVEAAEGDVTRLPKWAQQALADSSTAARRAAVQSAVVQAAPTAGADIARLLDSASFTAAVAQIDPADTTAVADAIKNAVTAQPWLAAVPQTPAKSGADFSDPGPGAFTAEQFGAMSYAERADLFQSDPETYRRLANH